MRDRSRGWVVAAILFAGLATPAFCAGPIDQADAPLPGDVKAVWDLAKAWHETTPTRERVCVNGLWRWRPADAAGGEVVPAAGWGYFKVPGSWPGITDYLQQDCQTVYQHPRWKETKLGNITAAWYQREIEVPAGWAGRRITLSLDYLNSFAAVYIDGKKIGEARFPAGEVDLTAACKPGGKHVLSMLVVALPLKAVRLSYTDSAAAREVKGTVARRGLCGDVYLVSTPAGPRVDGVRVETSVRRMGARFDAALAGLEPDRKYRLRARIDDNGFNEYAFTSGPFTATDVSHDHFAFSAMWKPDSLWDLDHNGFGYHVQLSLIDADGNTVDSTWRQPFGFREFWIDGRDFYLNGTRLYLSAVPLDNASMGASWANYDAARETFVRLKSIGINFVYTHNYDCEPGSHLSFEEILRAADDTGMLVALTMPHFSAYDWKADDADANNGYARDAAFYARVAQNHPSVVCYAMSHNATGYDGDMNPDLIDGLHDARDTWSKNNADKALRAEAIVHRIDPTRIVYHHAGGNIGSMHTANFYPNFAPPQELCDWFTHWAEVGVKPMFLCEYGAPFTWDWTMYRGWYKGKREFGSAAVPWEFCLAEWNAQFLGDRAFAMSEPEKADLRWEAKQFAAGKVWKRWEYPTEIGSARFEGRNEVLSAYLTDNWRAYRSWGVSGISPWEYQIYWTPRPNVFRGRRTPLVDWENLQRPGYSADYIDRQHERMDVAFDRADWIPTAAGKALLSNGQPVLAYIAGKADAFTSKDHNFRPGEVVEKQLILINNSRRPLTFRCEWSLALPTPITGDREVKIETGQQVRIPLRFELPAGLPGGAYEIRAAVKFSDGIGPGQEQTDSFTLDVMSARSPVTIAAKVALFDPRGQTAATLEKAGIKFQRVDAAADLSGVDTLVIGKLALSIDGPAPDLRRVPGGLKVIVFEQSSAVLEKRLGFRAVEYGLRQVFERIPDHPLLAGVTPVQLHDWRGEATATAPRIDYPSVPQHGPTTRWCDIPVSRVWRCGNRGNVASVLIEKPARGDFRPIIDGGFDLQYAPLMEYREGKGVILFCQLDVTGRTEADPAAEALVTNLIRYTAAFKPEPHRSAVYAGEQAGNDHLKSCGIQAAAYEGGDLSAAEQVLIIGPGGGQQLASHSAAIAAFLKAGGHLLAIGADQRDAEAILPFKVSLKSVEHISTTFDPPGVHSPLNGIGPADVENRGPRETPLVTSGAMILGDGVLALASAGGDEPAIVFCQLVPWQFDYHKAYDLKRTYRRASFTMTRLLANLGVSGQTALLTHFGTPAVASEKRWLDDLYLEVPEEWDDPYRFFRW